MYFNILFLYSNQIAKSLLISYCYILQFLSSDWLLSGENSQSFWLCSTWKGYDDNELGYNERGKDSCPTTWTFGDRARIWKKRSRSSTDISKLFDFWMISHESRLTNDQHQPISQRHLTHRAWGYSFATEFTFSNGYISHEGLYCPDHRATQFMQDAK